MRRYPNHADEPFGPRTYGRQKTVDRDISTWGRRADARGYKPLTSGQNRNLNSDQFKPGFTGEKYYPPTVARPVRDALSDLFI